MGAREHVQSEFSCERGVVSLSVCLWHTLCTCLVRLPCGSITIVPSKIKLEFEAVLSDYVMLVNQFRIVRLGGRDRVTCSSEGGRGRQRVRGHLASETGCGLNIGVVHKVVAGQ
jgi:hypothetical protein